MKGVGDAFRELADVIETMESNETVETEYDITDITPIKDNLVAEESLSVDIEMLVPFIDPESVGDGADLVLSGVDLTGDGSLRIDLRATVDRQSDCDDEAGASAREPGVDPEPEPNVKEGADEQKVATAEAESDLNPMIETEAETESEAEGEPAVGTEDEANSVVESEDAGENEDDAVAPTHGDTDVPPYRDPERLHEVYEACDTFAEMTDELAVDVTPQTVRRYMIKHGIHEPSSRNSTADSLLDASPDSVSASSRTGDASGGSSLTALTDGNGRSTETGQEPSAKDATAEVTIDETDSDATAGADEQKSAEHDDTDDIADETGAEDTKAGGSTVDATTDDEPDSYDDLGGQITDRDVELPDHLTLNQVKEVVRGAKTLYEAQRQLELDRNEARQLLQDLNLLNLVHGRLSTRNLEERSINEINKRIRAATAREHA